MISTTILTIRPADHTAGTAPATRMVEVRPPQQDMWVKVYDEETRYHKLVWIDASQAWFWTTEWQALEYEADEDLRQGRYEDFDSMDDFINSL